MLNLLAALNPMAYGFVKARRAATAAGLIVYCGIISVTDALWMWMGRNTILQLRTITTTVAFAQITSPVYLHPRLPRVSERIGRSCRPQDHQDPVPALNLQPIQYNLAEIKRQCPLSHGKLRGITRTCPPLYHQVPPPAKCRHWFTKFEEEPFLHRC